MTTQRISWRNLRENWIVFLFLVPTVLGVAIFSYIPAIEALRHSFYNWDGAFTEEFTGLDNLRRILGRFTLWLPVLLGGSCAGIAALVAGARTKLGLRIAAALAYLAAAAILAHDARSLPAGTSLSGLHGLLAVTAVAIVLAWRLPAGRWRAFAHFAAWFLPLVAGIDYLVSVRRTGDWLLWMSFRLIFILIVANLFKMWPSIFTAVCIHRL